MSGLFAILARRHKDKWYVAGLNGENQTKTLTIQLPMFAGREVAYYTDAAFAKGSPATLEPIKKTVKVDKKGNAKVSLQALGGLIITDAMD